MFVAFALAVGIAQRPDAFVASRDHAAIRYSSGPVSNPISELNQKLQAGTVKLAFDGQSGYLRSALNALAVPVESQVVVFSQTSNQARQIEPRNPRTIFFNDAVAIGYVRGGAVLELAAHDRRQGVIFYTLKQSSSETVRFERENNECLQCHLTWDTHGVPGMMVLSTFQRPNDEAYAAGFVSDHSSPFENRWGGWYITGRTGSVRHFGNIAMLKTEEKQFPIARNAGSIDSLEGRFHLTGYLSPHSDPVALMTLEHQTHAVNLITRLGWEARLAGQAPIPARVREAASALADYLLFVDETPLPAKIQGLSGFTEKFSARGPFDRQGRSLYQLDLTRRLLRYPCSYMIYAEAFDGLQDAAQQAVYQRLWQILSGEEKDKRYARLTLKDRQAVVEILRETKKGLPTYVQAVSR